MGNTVPAVAVADEAEIYHQEIRAKLPPEHRDFRLKMALMLTCQTTPQTVIDAAQHGFGIIKYIPYGVSTNSKESVPLAELPKYYPVLDAIQTNGMVFSGHWESLYDNCGRELEERDREEAAIPYLDLAVKTFPKLRIMVEHASSKKMINYVRQAPLNVRATLTVHHALLTFADVCWEPGVVRNPHNYCMPIAKSQEDRDEVVKATVSEDEHFGFGSDLAGHPFADKLKHPPKPGVFCPGNISAPLMLEIFLANNALAKIGKFRTRLGTQVYDLPQDTGMLELVKEDWLIPEQYCNTVPFMAGQTLRWKAVE